MLSGRMTDGGIGVSVAPGQDGGAIDDEVACPDQPTPNGAQHAQHEEGFWQGCSGGLTALALLGGTGNAWLAIVPQRQTTGQS